MAVPLASRRHKGERSISCSSRGIGTPEVMGASKRAMPAVSVTVNGTAKACVISIPPVNKTTNASGVMSIRPARIFLVITSYNFSVYYIFRFLLYLSIYNEEKNITRLCAPDVSPH
jgi:hypothetical protein